MVTKLPLITAGCLAITSVSYADAPKVVADVAPVHSLVSMVMEGVGAPDLLLEPGISPHGYSMRPSDAELLDEADLVFWVGEGLAPWLARAIGSLADDATAVELMEAEGLSLLPYREGATFVSGHDHGHGDEHDGHDDHDDHDHEEHAEGEEHHDDHDEHDHDEHAHDDHDEHDHEEHAEGEGHHDEHDHEEHAHGDEHDHDEHADEEEHAHGDEHDHEEHAEAHDDHDDHGHDAHAGHDHGSVDAHIWLDPVNAQVMLDAIATALADADPDHADQYLANASASKANLDTLIAEVDAQLEPYHDDHFAVFHDAYHYFETRFGVTAAGALALGDSLDPSATRVAEVRETVVELEVRCVFSEPQMNPELITPVMEGTGAGTGVLDPLGAALEPGSDLYSGLIKGLADSLEGCLKG